jgi:hypothetical protein
MQCNRGLAFVRFLKGSSLKKATVNMDIGGVDSNFHRWIQIQAPRNNESYQFRCFNIEKNHLALRDPHNITLDRRLLI